MFLVEFLFRLLEQKSGLFRPRGLVTDSVVLRRNQLIFVVNVQPAACSQQISPSSPAPG